MLNSNQVTFALQGLAYSEVQRRLRERHTLASELFKSQRTNLSGDVHPNGAVIEEISKQLIQILDSAALGKILSS